MNFDLIILIFILSTIIILTLLNNQETFETAKYNKIYLRSGDTDDHKLEFMYKPVISSIVKYIKRENREIKIDYAVGNYNFDMITKDDILIWVGNNNIPNFYNFRNKGIYVIYYNTEPDTDIFNVDEIWTYSKKLFDDYKKQTESQIIRFIPIILEENVDFVPYTKSESIPKLTFIGELGYRPEKREILSNNPHTKYNLIEINNLWNDDDFNAFVKKTANIYLNLTKSGTTALPSVRINKLLSHKSIIISEHTNPTDEQYYDGMVYFCKINDIGNVYKSLIDKTGKELQQTADEIYEKFYNKFYCENAYQLTESK